MITEETKERIEDKILSILTLLSPTKEDVRNIRTICADEGLDDVTVTRAKASHRGNTRILVKAHHAPDEEGFIETTLADIEF